MEERKAPASLEEAYGLRARGSGPPPSSSRPGVPAERSRDEGRGR